MSYQQEDLRLKKLAADAMTKAMVAEAEERQRYADAETLARMETQSTRRESLQGDAWVTSSKIR